MKVATGIRRLDDLLGGGVPPNSATLLYSPPFIGREVLARLFLLTGMRSGVPGVQVLTDQAAGEMRKEFQAMDPHFPDFERNGLAQFVDCYSRTIGVLDQEPNVEYVDGVVNLNQVSLAVNSAERKLIREHADHRLVIDSVSTLIAYTNAATAFRFLQVLVGKTKAAGATVFMTMEQGMHTEAEVQMVKHLVNGVIELKQEQGKYFVRVEGLGVTQDRGWIDYRFGLGTFEITGSFAAGRIR